MMERWHDGVTNQLAELSCNATNLVRNTVRFIEPAPLLSFSPLPIQAIGWATSPQGHHSEVKDGLSSEMRVALSFRLGSSALTASPQAVDDKALDHVETPRDHLRFETYSLSWAARPSETPNVYLT